MSKVGNTAALWLTMVMRMAMVDPAFSFDVAEPTFTFVRGELEGEKSRALVRVSNPNDYPMEQLKFSCAILTENNAMQYIEHPEGWLASLGSKGSETVWLELFGKPPNIPTGANCTLHEFKLMWSRR